MSDWQCVLTLDKQRRPVAGVAPALRDALRRGADLRIYTEFIHNEHIDPTSANPERIREVADFRVTYLLEDRWAAGIINLRMPIALPNGFGPRPSMSFFLYNEDGQQGIARPYLDGQSPRGAPGPSAARSFPDMPQYHQFDNWDTETNAPSHNFVYDFEVFRYCVSDTWREVLHHDAEGRVRSGSVDALVEAFSRGCEVKVGLRDLCADLRPEVGTHEVFVQVGSCYYYTQQRLFMAAAQPVVRVTPAIPLRYRSGGWDCGWLMPRSDGHVARWLCDPYTLAFAKSQSRHAIRWFVR